jgi:hypothetical protein
MTVSPFHPKNHPSGHLESRKMMSICRASPATCLRFFGQAQLLVLKRLTLFLDRLLCFGFGLSDCHHLILQIILAKWDFWDWEKSQDMAILALIIK